MLWDCASRSCRLSAAACKALAGRPDKAAEAGAAEAAEAHESQRRSGVEQPDPIEEAPEPRAGGTVTERLRRSSATHVVGAVSYTHLTLPTTLEV